MSPELDDLLGTVHHFSDGVYAKQVHIPKGTCLASHAHVYSHLSILAIGDVEVSVGGNITRYLAPAVITIERDTVHQVHALTDSVWFCVHATDVTNPDLVDDVLIKGN